MIDPFVDVPWLEAHREEVLVADVRWYADGRSGRDAYDAGHIDGAVFVDLHGRLAAPAGLGGRHPLPSPEYFQNVLSELGIGDDTTVVAYDDQGGVIAARFVWMLRATGREAALLDGGIQAWPHPLSTEPRLRGEGVVWPSQRPFAPGRLASIDDAATAADRGAVLIDARPAARFAGAPDPLDPRPGHIPGARSLPTREHLDGDLRLLPIETLRERFAAVGIDAPGETDVVSSCGSGVTACHNLLVMEHIGLGQGRLFPGSWSQWSLDPARPVATGDEPGR